MNEVIEWLNSPAGVAWSRANFRQGAHAYKLISLKWDDEAAEAQAESSDEYSLQVIFYGAYDSEGRFWPPARPRNREA